MNDRQDGLEDRQETAVMAETQPRYDDAAAAVRRGNSEIPDRYLEDFAAGMCSSSAIIR
jgi:hypothetical protein